MTSPVPAPWPNTFPFTELHSRGWTVEHASDEHIRAGGTGPVRTVTFTDAHGRVFTFDVDRQERMSLHGTFGSDTATVLTDSAFAVAALAATHPDAPSDELARIPDTRLYERYDR